MKKIIGSFNVYNKVGYIFCIIFYFLHVQAANIEAEASGVHDSEYQLTKHEFSNIGRGKYNGTNELCSPSIFGYFTSISVGNLIYIIE